MNIIQNFKKNFNPNLKFLLGSTSCKLTDSNCIKNTLEKNFPFLHNPNNNKEYPLIDPFFFELGLINFNRSQTARGTFTVKNMTILGANAVKFENLATKINGKFATVTTNISVQQLFASGWFKSDLSVSEFMFVTKGQFNLTMDDIKSQFIINGNLIENGHRFNVSDLEMRPIVKNMKFNVVGIVKNENISEITKHLIIIEFEN